ncbi:hypothetical protein JVV93_21545, partial [Vibrio cholerae O1]
ENSVLWRMEGTLMAKQKAVKKGGNPLRRNTTPMLVMFLTPAVLLYLYFLYSLAPSLEAAS